MASRRFSLGRSLDDLVTGQQQLWNGVAAAASDAVERTRIGLGNLGDSVNAVAGRLGDSQLAAQQQKVQLVQALAAKAPKVLRPPTKSPSAASTLAKRSPTARPQAENSTRAANIAGPAREALLTADAVMRGAADTLTFSLADEAVAGLRAAPGLFDGTYLEKFDRYHAEELERDQYDSENRAIARAVGRVAGLLPLLGARTSAAVLRNGGPKILSELRGGKALGAVPRIQTTGRELALASGAGGLVNGAAQTFVDVATGGKATIGDSLGAVVGGIASTPVAIWGSPGAAGAIEGLVTSMSQDAFNGRPISFDAALDSARNGAAGAHVGDALGTARAKALSSYRKGKLGESLSMLKTRARGDLPIGRNERRYLSHSYTVVDPASTASKTAESKFGPFAQVYPQQLLGWEELPDYRFDWWQPTDVGRIAAFGGASLATNLDGSQPVTDDALLPR